MRRHIARLRSRFSPLCSVLFGALLAFSGNAFAAAPVLERVIVVERHGVRSPTIPRADLAKYSDEAWPDWHVPDGELTVHGQLGLVVMGKALRAHYSKDGFLPRGGCVEKSLFVYADGKDSRTIASAVALMRGFNPAPCRTEVNYGPEKKPDPIFDAVEGGVCTQNAATACNSIAPRLAAILASNAVAYAQARRTLQSILTPGWSRCAQDPNRKQCLIAGGDNVLCRNGALKLDGPLNLGSSLSEIILLERAQGMPDAEVGWNRAPYGAIALSMPLHNLYSRVMRSDPYLASRRGSTLMQEILDALEGRPSTFQGHVPLPATARFVLFLGHDTNLANLGGILGVDWTLPGEPDATGPAAAMAFELWRTDTGPQVAVRMLYPTLAQLRDLAPAALAPPVTLPVSCAPGRACSPSALQARLDPALAKDCLKPQ